MLAPLVLSLLIRSTTVIFAGSIMLDRKTARAIATFTVYALCILLFAKLKNVLHKSPREVTLIMLNLLKVVEVMLTPAVLMITCCAKLSIIKSSVYNTTVCALLLRGLIPQR
jgi:hypothetical protein